MLISLLAWTYLSILCLVWGHMLLYIITPVEKDDAAWPHPCLVCLAGLAAVSSLSFGLSLAIPLGGKAHVIFLGCALLWLLNKKARRQIRMLLHRLFENYTTLPSVLLAAGIAMVLVISVHTINHPDTLIYHAKAIFLLQRYPPIPGIANLRVQLGYQSCWFAALAVTNPFPQQYDIIFLNGSVLCWFLIYVAPTLRRSWTCWALLAYSLASWTQIRLTAASASPDFIVALYCWAAILAFLDDHPARRNSCRALVVIFCMAAVLTKMSGMMILLLAVPALAAGKPAETLKLLAWCLVSTVILCVRNVLASGYMLFPSSWPDVFNVPWKIPLTYMRQNRDYTTEYAFMSNASPGTFLSLSPVQKILEWWSHIELPDRVLLLAIAGGLLVRLGLIIVRRDRSFLSGRNVFPFLVALAGSCLWMLKIPSPRFGTGFLVPLAYFLWHPLPWPKMPVLQPYLIRGTAWCMIAAVSAYTIYRCIRFTTTSNLLTPSGIALNAYKPNGCDQVKVDLLHDTIISQGPSAKCLGSFFNSFPPMGATIRQCFEPAVPSP